MPDPARDPKIEARRSARARLREVGPEARDRASGLIVRTLLGWPIFAAARTVMFYASLPDEPELWPAARSLLARGGVACFPRVEWGSASMEPASVRDSAELASDARGLRHPAGSCPAVAIEGIDLVLAPGLAFDLAGNRLGRGGGFYDRFLSRPGLRASTCGVGFEAQVVPEVPRQAWDARLQHLVTEATLRTFSE